MAHNWRRGWQNFKIIIGEAKAETTVKKNVRTASVPFFRLAVTVFASGHTSGFVLHFVVIIDIYDGK